MWIFLTFHLSRDEKLDFIGKVQAGLDPDDWKSFGKVGSGTREIRIRDAAGIYRVMGTSKNSKNSFSPGREDF